MGRYDLSLLGKCGQLDAIGAISGFPSREDFFVALTELNTNGAGYLRGYASDEILGNEETKERFIKEMGIAWNLMTSLRVKQAPVMLDALMDAVQHNDELSLAEGLKAFHAEMDSLVTEISGTLLAETETNVRPVDLPLIMAVDDMPEILTTISEMLLDEYRVIALTSGFSAVSALQTQTPALFILDIEMPGMNGYALAKHIRSTEKFSKTPILFLTSHSTREYVLAAKLHGGNAFLIKPVKKEDLLEKIAQNI